LIRDYRNF